MINKKNLIVSIFCLLSLTCVAQSEQTVLRINKLVGDTVDLQEKLKYGVFPDIVSDSYQYAVCILQDDQMKLRVNFGGTSFQEYPYSSESMLADIDRIVLNQNAPVEPLQQSTGKQRIIVTSKATSKSIKLKKGKGIELKLRNENQVFRARIKKVITNGQQAIMVRREYGNNQVIPLSEIDYIYRYRRLESWAWKGSGGLFFVAGVAAIISDPAENYPLGSVFVVGGGIPFLFPNQKIRMDEARIDVR